MAAQDLKKEIDEVMKKEGNVKGAGILADLDFIREEKGEEGIKAIEGKLKEFGYPFKLDELKVNEFYSNGLSSAIIVLAKELFGWTEQDVFRMGSAAAQFSEFNKLLARYFVSLEVLIGKSKEQWHKYFDFGNIEVGEFDKEKKQLTLKITGFDAHPLYCPYLAGYIRRLIQLTARGVEVEEKKCIYRGDAFHEYKVTWK